MFGAQACLYMWLWTDVLVLITQLFITQLQEHAFKAKLNRGKYCSVAIPETHVLCTCTCVQNAGMNVYYSVFSYTTHV